MAEPVSHDQLIGRLAADLSPSPRLASPLLRALAWTGMIGALALAIMAVADLRTVAQHMRESPETCLALVGSAAAAFTAALAAFQTSVPGSDRRWVLLPLPALLVWLAASGAGCLAARPVAAGAPLAHTGECFAFILGASLPLSALMLVMLGRALPLRPSLTAGLGGLAAAAAAATLLALFHPFDIAWLDLLVHAAAVGSVVGASRIFGQRYLPEGLR